MKVNREYSRNLGQRLILARRERELFMKKGHFFEKEKGPKKFTPPPLPYSISFLSVLHQNKALDNFCKRGQHSIVECNIGLDYFNAIKMVKRYLVKANIC